MQTKHQPVKIMSRG